MSVLASRRTIRIDMEAASDGREQWVDMRTQLNAGMRDDLLGRLYKKKVEEGASDRELEVDVKVAVSSVVALEYWIVDWCIYDEDGQPFAFTAASIKLLDGDVADDLLRRTREFASASAEKKEDSPLEAVST